MTPDGQSPQQLEQRATEAFREGSLEESIDLFHNAQQSYLAEGDETQAAKVANSLGVVLLQANRPHEALEAIRDTPEFFLERNDEPNAAQAFGNLGAVLEACGETEAAEKAYREAIQLFSKLGESDLHAYTLQALSRMQLRRGQPIDALSTMQAGLEAMPRRGIRDRLLRRFLNLPFRLFGR